MSEWTSNNKKQIDKYDLAAKYFVHYISKYRKQSVYFSQISSINFLSLVFNK